jgi:hypothetical protein
VTEEGVLGGEGTAAAEEEKERPEDARRFLVRLAVRFVEARDYVIEYAENLSRGGLFVAGAQHLNPLEQVTIRVDLPGFGAYDVDCRVAHTLSEEQAARLGRRPGAGFAIMSAPEGFHEALSRYLLILGRRRDATVVVSEEQAAELLSAAGYQIERTTDPESLAAGVEGLPEPPLAVVVPHTLAPAYRAALATTSVADLVVGVGDEGPTDSLLNALDQRIARRTVG